MKKILILASCFLLVSCIKNPVKEDRKNTLTTSDIPNCQNMVAGFLEQAQVTTEAIERNMWIVDIEVFYSPKIQACVGKYMASRKEGNDSDASLFVIKDIMKNEDIYFQKYTGPELKNEHEGQKAYRTQIASLK